MPLGLLSSPCSCTPECLARPAMAVGHRAALALLRLLPVAAAGQPAVQAAPQAASKAGQEPPAAAPKALLWRGRSTTAGRSRACALAVPAAPLISAGHALLQTAADGSVWLADTSAHGTLLLPLPEGTAALGAAISGEQLDALPWTTATMLDKGAAVPLAGERPTLLVLGLHRTDWLAGARDGMAAELAAKGAALLVYERLPGAAPAAAAAAAE